MKKHFTVLLLPADTLHLGKSKKHCLNTKTYCFSLKNSHPVGEEEILIQSDGHLYGESKMDFNSLANIHEPKKQERKRISAVVSFRSRQT